MARGKEGEPPTLFLYCICPLLVVVSRRAIMSQMKYDVGKRYIWSNNPQLLPSLQCTDLMKLNRIRSLGDTINLIGSHLVKYLRKPCSSSSRDSFLSVRL